MKQKKHASTAKPLSAERIDAIENQVYLLAEVIVSANYFIVDVKMELENGRWYLRVYLDHPNDAVRITLDDCKDISAAVSPMIDENVAELEGVNYTFEVSSPGLFRTLNKPREFRFYAGRRIELKPKGQDAFIAYLDTIDEPAGELVYRLSPDPDAESHRIAWNPKTLGVSLSPDPAQPVELKTVPRRINRDD